MKKDHQTGFTLIEMSIVLVIIGLIVGGVLVGRDLIHAAEIRKSISVITEYNTAFRTFQSKFNCLPGDCPNATDFGFACNGNGDGQIYDTLPSCDPSAPTVKSEINNAGNHMAAANLLPGTPDTWWWGAVAPRIALGADLIMATLPNPANNLGGGTIGLYVANYGGNGFPNPNPNVCANSYYCQSLTASDAYAVDNKIDDGIPDKGNFYNRGAFVYPSQGMANGAADGHHQGPGGPTAAYCLNSSVTPIEYNIVNVSDKVCLPFYVLN